MFITCNVIAAAAIVDALPAQPKVPTYTLILTGPSYDHSESDEKWVNEIYDSVQPSGDIANLPRQKAPGTFSPTFTNVKPRPGHLAIETVYIDPILSIN